MNNANFPLCLIDTKIRLNATQLKSLSKKYALKSYDMQEKEHTLWRKAEVILLHSKLCDERIEELEMCQYIGIRAHNLDYVNQELVRQKGMVLKGIAPVGQVAVAEHTFGLIFALAKQLRVSQQNMLNGRWREGLAFNLQLRGKTLGIIGRGEIANEVALMAKAFGLNVMMVGRKDDEGLERLLKISDIITVHIPSTKENYHFIDKAKLSKMKPTVLIINTSRGDIMDYEALEEALKNRTIAGVGLDVFPTEPLQNLKLLAYETVIATPHVAFNTVETVEAMNEGLVEEILKIKLR